jgi:hypothetical protein
MPTAQQLRAQIEAKLANRIPSALSPAPRLIRETITTGIPEIDQLTNGGLPLGAITEIIGAPSTGRTTLAMSLLARVSQSGNVCAWIDATDEFDTVSAAANGIVLQQLLLVRCGVLQNNPGEAVTRLSKRPVDAPVQYAQSLGGHGSNHPRNEGRGLDKAVGQLLQQKLTARTLKPGTPGVPNLKLSSVTRDEQITLDRLPSRRGHPALKVDLDRNTTPHLPSTLNTQQHQLSPWQQIERSIRVLDLLLQYGGFKAIVLDLASFKPEFVNKLPIATWFRFRSLVDTHRSCLVLLTQLPCAQSSAALSLQLANPQITDEVTVMTGLQSRAIIYRQRFATSPSNVLSLRKEPQSERTAKWHADTAWVSL